ncbi:MAG: hypothetical protein JJE39_11555 [Vicinamibacteria bacterium]|nr:hypothetical protein [Vicinamibacteria bacterium]
MALPLTLAFSSCGDGLDLTPNLSGPVGSPSGSTTPTPSATPTPTPAATVTPTGLTCGLSSRPDCGGSGCCSEGGSNDFVGVINDAQAALERSNPEIFNSNGSLRVGEIEYTTLLATKITSMTGVCAIGGGNSSRSKDEIGLKRDNDRSINVDVIIGSSNTPYIGGIYTCRPASF